MRMNGMKMRDYWFVNFVFSFILSAITNFVFCMFGFFVLKSSIFVNTGWDVLTVVLLGWILAQIGLSTFLQVFLASSQAANIIGYLFSIWTNLIGATLSIAIFQYPSHQPFYISLFPTFAFNRIFYLMFTDCSSDHCYTSLSLIPDEVKYCIYVLYGSFVVFQLLGMYLYEVVPQEFGTTQPLGFPFKFITDRCKKEEPEKFIREEIFQNQDELARSERGKIRSI